jgi:hypothetical protein
LNIEAMYIMDVIMNVKIKLTTPNVKTTVINNFTVNFVRVILDVDIEILNLR